MVDDQPREPPLGVGQPGEECGERGSEVSSSFLGSAVASAASSLWPVSCSCAHGLRPLPLLPLLTGGGDVESNTAVRGCQFIPNKLTNGVLSVSAKFSFSANFPFPELL